jgi:penicillin amidase
MPMPRWIKVSGVFLAVVLVVVTAGLGWTYHLIARSVPLLEGEVEVVGLSEPVTVDRDALGVPTIRGSNREDVARALGFIHGQERFFQMDLARRRAAGELAELFGSVAVDADRASRLHRFRHRSEQRVAELAENERTVLMAYTEGVNAGLDEIDGTPFEYVLLRAEPKPWKNEDSVLVLFAMYFLLNDENGDRESDLGLLMDLLPTDLAAFLAPSGTEWDAPIIGDSFGNPPIPAVDGPPQRLSAESIDRTRSETARDEALVGSNNWAVAGNRTHDGRAILANDMHLGLGIPNTWYRVVLEWPADDGCEDLHELIGVTLPGFPVVVAGSNTRVSWGFTNSYGDWSDLVIIEVDPKNPDRYRTPDGWRQFHRVADEIVVRDGETVSIEVSETVWGPIVDHDHLGRPRSIRWIAHDPGGANLGFLGLEHASSIEQAFDVANRSGIPPQNFVCADANGRIGWTVIGRIPRRFGAAGRLPTSWADGTNGWDGWLNPSEYPRVADPPDGLIWTANARVVGGEMLEVIGDGGYDLGARAQQIRDGLRAIGSANEADMLAVQLDDRAVFLERWRRLLLEILDGDAVSDRPKRERFRKLVESTWTGRAETGSSAYRLVRAYRTFAFERIFGWLTAPCKDADEDFSIYRLPQEEGPLWRLVSERPPHLLDDDVSSWRDVLLEVVDSTIAYYEELGGELDDHTWGVRNNLAMRHPLSRAVPVLARWLDMPGAQLPGDSNMPRVQSPGFGASERMAVSPGHERDGYFHMPGGQSGHPLSPYYRAGHDAWAEGEATPLLPGASEHTLVLVPAVR